MSRLKNEVFHQTTFGIVIVVVVVVVVVATADQPIKIVLYYNCIPVLAPKHYECFRSYQLRSESCRTLSVAQNEFFVTSPKSITHTSTFVMMIVRSERVPGSVRQKRHSVNLKADQRTIEVLF